MKAKKMTITTDGKVLVARVVKACEAKGWDVQAWNEQDGCWEWAHRCDTKREAMACVTVEG